MPGNCKLKYLERGKRISCKILVAILTTTLSHLLQLLINWVRRYIRSTFQLQPFYGRFLIKELSPYDRNYNCQVAFLDIFLMFEGLGTTIHFRLASPLYLSIQVQIISAF